MAIKSLNAVKADFQTGDRPTGANFVDMIDTLAAQASGAVQPNTDPARAASTANLVLSGEQTVDDVDLVDGEDCVAKDQDDKTENGKYTVSEGAWARSSDANEASELEGMILLIQEGTANGGKLFAQQTSPVTLGVSEIEFVVGTAIFDGHDEAPL